jgi:PKD repeat protein
VFNKDVMMKRYGACMNPREDGVSEVLDETLILVMGLLCAAVVMIVIFGVLPPLQNTAYVIPQFGIKNVSGSSAIYLFDRGGDTVYFNATPLTYHKAALYVDTSAGTFTAVPSPGVNIFRPGDLVYLYYTGSGFIITNNLTGAPITTLPAGQVAVRMVDANSNVLISQEIVVKGATTTSPTATPAATATATATATPVPVSLAANFNWVENGKGGDVHFTDTSTGSPTSWSWVYGDGGTSTSQNPVHNFGKAASFDVTLTVTASGATSTITKTIKTV